MMSTNMLVAAMYGPDILNTRLENVNLSEDVPATLL